MAAVRMTLSDLQCQSSTTSLLSQCVQLCVGCDVEGWNTTAETETERDRAAECQDDGWHRQATSTHRAPATNSQCFKYPGNPLRFGVLLATRFYWVFLCKWRLLNIIHVK